MYLLHTLLSEYQQVPQYANSGRRVKFCRQYECFNPTPLHPHLGAYASDRSKTVVLAVHEMSKKYLCAVLVFLRQHQRPRLWMFSITEVGVDC